MRTQRKACLLDRDGTIIVDRIYLNTPKEIEYLPSAIEGLQKMQQMGFMLFVVTNQSGIARGLVQIENLYRIHQQIREDLAQHGVQISGFYYAPYSADSDHPARKPNPGMLEYAALDFGLDLQNSWMIGDRMIDVEAGHRAGCKSILVGNTVETDVHPFAPPEARFENLAQAADFILNLQS